MLGWLACLIAALLIEFLTWRVSGRTLSQHLWAAQARRPWVRSVTIAIGTMLTVHLAYRWSFTAGAGLGLIVAGVLHVVTLRRE